MSPRQADAQFTAEQHQQYYHDAVQRLKRTGKSNFSMHDLRFHGKGAKGYFWPVPELLNYEPQGKTSFVRLPLCGHGIIAATYNSIFSNINKGKHALRCGKGKDSINDCGYWYWVHEIPRRTRRVLRGHGQLQRR